MIPRRKNVDRALSVANLPPRPVLVISRAPAVATLEDTVAYDGPSKTQVLGAPTLSLGWNEESDFSPPKLGPRIFAVTDDRDLFMETDPVQTFRVPNLSYTSAIH